MSRGVQILEMIEADMKTDVEEFNGKPFTGKTLGELHGTLCATVQALAIYSRVTPGYRALL